MQCISHSGRSLLMGENEKCPLAEEKPCMLFFHYPHIYPIKEDKQGGEKQFIQVEAFRAGKQ